MPPRGARAVSCSIVWTPSRNIRCRHAGCCKSRRRAPRKAAEPALLHGACWASSMCSFSFIALTQRDIVISATSRSKATDACDFPPLITTSQIFLAMPRSSLPCVLPRCDLSQGARPATAEAADRGGHNSREGPGAGVILIGRLAQAAGIVGAFRGAGSAPTLKAGAHELLPASPGRPSPTLGVKQLGTFVVSPTCLGGIWSENFRSFGWIYGTCRCSCHPAACWLHDAWFPPGKSANSFTRIVKKTPHEQTPIVAKTIPYACMISVQKQVTQY
jgi:hypothetical protein